MTPNWLAWPEIQRLTQAFAAANAPLRFVGGCVRDTLLQRPVQDIDAATPLLPQAVIELLQAAKITALPTGIDHGTVTALIDKKPVEITTLRTDIACDGRHAEVTFTDDWQADAARRDFTMNALYLSPEGELFDYFGGAEDAKAGCIIFIGNPKERIEEDYLRILRFFRFYACYGKEAMDLTSIDACAALANGMDALSGERIQHEMLKLLAATPLPAYYQALNIMQHHCLLPHILNVEIKDCALLRTIGVIEQVTHYFLPPYMKLAAFALSAATDPKASLESIIRRLKLSNAMSNSLHTVLAHQAEIQLDMKLPVCKILLRRLGKEHFQWAVILKWALDQEAIFAHHPYHEMLLLADHWQLPLFPVTGKDLIACGITPGKLMGQLLQQLEKKWEQEDYQPSREALLAAIPSFPL